MNEFSKPSFRAPESGERINFSNEKGEKAESYLNDSVGHMNGSDSV